MKPPQPLNPSPLLTVITPTYRRPQQLEACLRSVGAQTAAHEIQHIVLPDHVGHGIVDGLYARLAWYAPVVRGRYVNILCDDDVLADETLVSSLASFVEARQSPPVVMARVRKGHMELPSCAPEGPPQCGHVDMTSYIVRADVWQAHVHDYGKVYEGDYWHAKAVYDAGYATTYWPALWAIGGASNGRPEY